MLFFQDLQCNPNLSNGSVSVTNAHTESRGVRSPEAVQGRFLFLSSGYYILIYEIVSGTHSGRSRRLIDTIAVLKREAEQATLDNPRMGAKLTHYPDLNGAKKRGHTCRVCFTDELGGWTLEEKD